MPITQHTLILTQQSGLREGMCVICVTLALLRVVFPLRGSREAAGRKSAKNGEKLLIPLPGPTPENGEKLQKNYNIVFSE